MKYISEDLKNAEKCELSQFFLPIEKIVAYNNVETPEFLMKREGRQADLHFEDCCNVKKGGYVVLDFGREICGGIYITAHGVSEADNSYFRITFGESVSEAMGRVGEDGASNDHSPRDLTIFQPLLSHFRVGSTGFRFVKIEATTCDIQLRNVEAVLEIRDMEYKGSFICNDERLNKIWQTAAYTVQLNMQECMWDGIKRDRLVWIGDMHPETSTASVVFGDTECVRRSLDFARRTPPTEWMNSIPSYSMWWIIIHYDLYMHFGNKEELFAQKDYMVTLIKRIADNVNEDGTYKTEEIPFVDWSSNKTGYEYAGFRGVRILCLERSAEIMRIFNEPDLAEKCERAVENLKKITEKYDGNKQASALVALARPDMAKEICQNVILKNGVEGLSTFMGYYVLCALGEQNLTDSAIEIIRDFWGAMLDLGATSFWEDFDIAWTENAARIDEIAPEGKIDVHKSYGKFCYQQHRHSLCHGWAGGPAAFMMKYVLGVRILEAGCKKVEIKPQLGNLEFVKGTFPTPYGIIEIEHKKQGGRVVSKIIAPDGVEVV